MCTNVLVYRTNVWYNYTKGQKDAKPFRVENEERRGEQK